MAKEDGLDLLGKPGEKMEDPLGGVDRKKVSKATGRKYRKNREGDPVGVLFRLPPEWKQQIEDIADDLGTTQEDVKQWLVSKGLEAWEAGDRPETRAKKAPKRKIVI